MGSESLVFNVVKQLRVSRRLKLAVKGACTSLGWACVTTLVCYKPSCIHDLKEACGDGGISVNVRAGSEGRHLQPLVSHTP